MRDGEWDLEKMKRTDKVLAAVVELTEQFDLQHPRESLPSVYVAAIAARTGISSNNASMELVRLFKEGDLVKVGGRPVSYLSADCLERHLGIPLPTRSFENAAAFLAALFPAKGEEGHAGAPSGGADCPSAFDGLIGAEGSLLDCIEQAKAAVLYPPDGLHTLITGQTGVGKSLFANCMYDYANQSGALSRGSPMVTFNCANYSDNPQLLLSQLFGYCRGAFTGANQDKPGLVEYADGGMLFLDEIHRLNPEGQEKLFLLLDRGIFRRMGETQKERRVNLRLIGATTESPKDCMLSTFLRRIPVHIVLPSLSERSVRERMTLALYFLWKEAGKLRRRIYLDQEILSALVHYKCYANIGQLETDIRLTCANVYYKLMVRQTDAVRIRLSYLSQGIQQGLFTSRGASSSLVSKNLNTINEVLVIDGETPFHRVLDTYLHEVEVVRRDVL